MKVRRAILLSLLLIGGTLGVHGQDAPLAEIHVASTPSGATISIDGKMRGETPRTLSNLPPGTHLLQLTKRGYREVLQSVSVAGGQKQTIDNKLEPITGLFLLHSTPPRATVEIDGIDRGTTPVLIRDLPLGTYRARVFKNGFLPKEIEIKVEDRTPFKVATTLTSDSATLALESTPGGASVSINGIPRGTTPVTVPNIPEGETTIQLALSGYDTFRQTMKLAAGQEETITVRLRPLPATLTIESIPPDARVYVDNQFKGTAPLVLKDLDPGFYRIRAELPSYDTLARTIELKRAQTLVEEFRLQANVGGIRITTQPAGVLVLVDGKEAGATSSQPDKTDQVSEPLELNMISPGTHTVQLVKTGHHSQSTTLTVARDEVVTQHFRMKRMWIPDTEVKTHARIFRGVRLPSESPDTVRLETAPGVTTTIPANEIISCEPLRTDATEP